MTGVTRQKILNYVSQYLKENNHFPTYREIGQAVGLRSPSAVSRHVHALIDSGQLASSQQNPRSEKINPPSEIILNDAGSVRRIRIDVSDGGKVYFDCNLANRKHGMAVEFSGIFDASELKGQVSRIVSCRIDADD